MVPRNGGTKRCYGKGTGARREQRGGRRAASCLRARAPGRDQGNGNQQQSGHGRGKPAHGKHGAPCRPFPEDAPLIAGRQQQSRVRFSGGLDGYGTACKSENLDRLIYLVTTVSTGAQVRGDVGVERFDAVRQSFGMGK